ncbi:unnamed protein product, partial [Prorocentrum cordatum]
EDFLSQLQRVSRKLAGRDDEASSGGQTEPPCGLEGFLARLPPEDAVELARPAPSPPAAAASLVGWRTAAALRWPRGCGHHPPSLRHLVLSEAKEGSEWPQLWAGTGAEEPRERSAAEGEDRTRQADGDKCSTSGSLQGSAAPLLPRHLGHVQQDAAGITRGSVEQDVYAARPWKLKTLDETWANMILSAACFALAASSVQLSKMEGLVGPLPVSAKACCADHVRDS